MSLRIVVTLVVAVAENGVIGRVAGLPWHLSSDLRRFRALTVGKPVIMGRKTFLSIGKPLAGRNNIVVSRSGLGSASLFGALPPDTSVHDVASLEAALALGRKLAEHRGVDEVIVAGGGEIYASAMPFADRIHLTRVHASPEGDTHFSIPDPRVWLEVSRERHPAGPGDDHAWTAFVLERAATSGVA